LAKLSQREYAVPVNRVKSLAAADLEHGLRVFGDGPTLMARIVIVDDERHIRAFLTDLLRAEGYDVEMAADGSEALALCGRQAPDLVITDMFMAGMDGMQMIGRLRRDFPAVNVIAVSGGGVSGEIGILAQARKAGATATLEKPFGIDALLATVKETLAKPRRRSSEC
jgi:CheY-like chemotaxis protein